MNASRLLVVISLVLFVAPSSFAEDVLAAPQPTAEHKALATWVGNWTGSGEMKPGPFGPGGHMEWTENCTWFGSAEFHVVCKSKGDSPMGPMKGLGIIGYDPGKKVYTHYGVDNNGWAGYSEGTKSGDSWTFESTETMEGKTYHTRFTMKMVSTDEMTFVWEMSEDGKNWIALMSGVSSKK